MISTPEQSSEVMNQFGMTLAFVLRSHGLDPSAEVVEETIDRFNLMYRTLYEIANTSSDWNGNSTKARETLEKVNK